MAHPSKLDHGDELDVQASFAPAHHSKIPQYHEVESIKQFHLCFASKAKPCRLVTDPEYLN